MARRDNDDKSEFSPVKFLIGLLVVIIIVVYVIFRYFFSMTNKIGDEDKEQTIISITESIPDVDELLGNTETADIGEAGNEDTDFLPSGNELINDENIKTILIVGVDSREDNFEGRSDSMILVSVNSAANRILMTSFLRDIYVSIPDTGSDRLNAAYAYGGTDLLEKTIESNFGIPVDNTIVINFYFVRDFVDAVGGVDVELTAEEIEVLNGYLISQNDDFGKVLSADTLPVEAGTYTLNGNQALAYSRIRYIGTDFARTGRQRNVMSLCMDKVKQMGLREIMVLAKNFLPRVGTDLTEKDCLSLFMALMGVSGNYETSEFLIPADGTWSNANIDGKAVLNVDFERNSVMWYELMTEK